MRLSGQAVEAHCVRSGNWPTDTFAPLNKTEELFGCPSHKADLELVAQMLYGDAVLKSGSDAVSKT